VIASAAAALLAGVLAAAANGPAAPAGPARTPAGSPTVFQLAPADSARVRAEIDTLNARLVRAFTRNDAAAYASIYAEDGVKLIPLGRQVRGRPAIAAFMEPLMRRLRLREGVIETRTLWLVGDDAYEAGRFTFVFHPVDKSVQTDQGHYVNVWRRGSDGAWRLWRDMRIFLE
jgi:uncharacterized protein (TIGR02246 family)